MVEEKGLKFGELFDISPRKGLIKEDETVTFLGMEDVSEDGKVMNQHKMPFSRIKNGLTYFEKDDVLVAKITPCFENGKGACLDELQTSKGFGSTEFHVLRAKQNSEPRYIFYHSQSSAFRKKLETEMIGTAGQKRVPINSIINYELPTFHHSQEQKAIAEILSDTDSLISSLEKLIEKKKKIKKGAMQELLTGKKRLSGYSAEWEVKKLEEITYSISSGISNSKSQEGKYPLYGSTGVIGSCDNYNYEGSKILVARVGANAGTINLVEGKYCVSDNTLIINIKQNTHTKFLYFILENFKLNRLVFGSGQPLITGSQLKDLEFNIPNLEEQQSIAQILTDMDKEIEALEQKLQKYKSIKQGMMNDLLTGKTRLLQG